MPSATSSSAKELKHSSSLQTCQYDVNQATSTVAGASLTTPSLLKNLKTNVKNSQGVNMSNASSHSNAISGANKLNMETASLNSFNDTNSLMSNSLLTDTQSANLDYGSEHMSNSKVMENYLILDRLNKKQQERKQELKQKQLQQLNELKQKQHDLEMKFREHHQQHQSNEMNENRDPDDLDTFKSKLTSHYNIVNAANTNPTTAVAAAAAAAATSVFNKNKIKIDSTTLNKTNEILNKSLNDTHSQKKLDNNASSSMLLMTNPLPLPNATTSPTTTMINATSTTTTTTTPMSTGGADILLNYPQFQYLHNQPLSPPMAPSTSQAFPIQLQQFNYNRNLNNFRMNQNSFDYQNYLHSPGAYSPGGESYITHQVS